MSGVRTFGLLMTAVGLSLPAATVAQQPVVTESPADTTAEFELTVAEIMRGPELVGSPPRAVRWTDDGEWVYFRWKPGGVDWHEDASLYRVRADGGDPERLSDEAADSVGPLLAGGDVSADGDARVVSHGGDLYLIDRESLETRRLTETDAAERSPIFGDDGRTVYFVRDDSRGGAEGAAGNVFSFALDRGEVRQLTDIRSGSPPRDEEPEGREAFLRDQQRELFEHIRREAEEREEREAEREEREAEEPETVWIENGERLFGIEIEPGARWALLAVGRPADDPPTMVPDWVTESGYTEERRARPKVGGAQSQSRLGLLTIGSGAVEWLELVPDSGHAAAPSGGGYGDSDRLLANVDFLGWNDDGTTGLIAAVGYAFKDQWLYTVDARTAELTLVAHDHDEAWIGGPCSTWTSSSCAGWMPDGESVWFVSERDGYSHLYTVGADGGGLDRLTRGEWEVHSVEVSPDEDRFLMTTSEGSPFERHFYRMDLDGDDRSRITGEPGHNDVSVSPGGDRLAVVHSYANRPPELFLMENEPGAEMERVTTSPTEEWSSFGWIAPEIVRFEAEDGARVPARIYRPEDVGAAPNGAGVIFVHGAGYLHNVHDGWSSYYREYMFHHVLASRGYTVLDIDYRGSAGYGRDWRTAIYRHMGGKDLTDQVDGARYLVENEGVESYDRIGIYGGSYGGFITLMALFTRPERFGAGAALRSVTDWAHYNHWYTSRILNLPQNDEEAYRQSSPIHFAEGLEDPLLIAHGMVDTNVHFQDVVRLAQRLIELGKTGWEMAVYPVEGHSFSEPASWTDEYRRILELFEANLRDARATSEDE